MARDTKFDWTVAQSNAPKEVLNGRTVKQYNLDASEHQTYDGLAVNVKADPMRPIYYTNSFNTKFVDIIVESKYAADEVTGFIGCSYSRGGKVKRFQAKFLLNKQVRVPATAIPILRNAKVLRRVKDEKGKKSVKPMQKYIVEVVNYPTSNYVDNQSMKSEYIEQD